MRQLPPSRCLRLPALRVAGFLAALALSGCTTYTDYSAFVRNPKPLVTSTEYRLAPPDVITITSRVVRETDGHTEQIRPDGKITLPLIGSVFIAGKTCEDVSADLQARYREFYREADISLRVAAFRSKHVYVFGEVSAPGPYEYDGANTILGTLARAQPTRLAYQGHIDVLRPNADGKLVKHMTIDLNEMVHEGDTTHDAVLEEGDIIYVPPSPLARVGLALQELLLPIQPAASTVKGPADIGDTVTGSTTYGGRNTNQP
jgi:polysaccharide export outer membrane protein